MRTTTTAKPTTQRATPSSRAPARAGGSYGARLSLRSLGNRAIAIGERGDTYEREAERLAPKLAQGASVSVEGAVSNTRLQLQLGSSPQASAIATTVQGSARSGGPLPHRLRDEYSASLGTDLSPVRVHTDNDAAQLNARLHSRAVTWGSNIYFATGQYNPHTQAGRELIAHETVHTVQQDFGHSPAAMRLQCDKTKDEVIQGLAGIEAKTQEPLEKLRFDPGLRETLPGFLEKQLKTKPDTIKKYVLEYEQDFQKEIADLIAKAQSIKVAPPVSTLVSDALKEIDAAKKRVEAAIAAGGNASFLKLQADYLDAARAQVADPALAKAGSAVAVHGGGVVEGAALSFIKSLPLAQDSDEMRLAIEDAIAVYRSLTGNVAAQVRNLKTPLISISFWKDMLFNAKTPDEELEESTERGEEATQGLEEQTGKELEEEVEAEVMTLTEEEQKLLLELAQQQGPVADDPKKLLEKLKNLTPLERKILEANKLLNQRSETATAGDITLNLGDVEAIASGSQAEQDVEKSLSEAEKLLATLSSKNKKKSTSIDFSPIRDALRGLQTEMVMFKGLLRGASSRYAELKSFETDLAEAIEGFFKAMQESMMKDLVVDVAISLIPYVGGPTALLRKIAKIVSLINKIRTVLSIIDTLKNVVDVVGKARSQIGVIESKLKQLDQFTADEDYEELVFQLIEEHNLLDYLVLPDFESMSEEDIQNEVLKIVRDIPKGLVAFGDMFTLYESLPSNPSKDELAGLAVASITAGVLLSPVVVFLAMTALTTIAGAIASFDKSFIDRLNPVNRRHRKRKSLKDKQDKSKDRLGKSRRTGYDYQAQPIKDLIERDYKPALEAELNNSDNSFGGHTWTEPYFKHFVQEEVKAFNAKRGTKRVSAKVKKKKKTDPDVSAMAPMLALRSPSFKTKFTPWKVELRTKIVNTDVEVKPDASKFNVLEYKHFAGTGIAYDPKQMTGKHKPRKRRELDKWLRKKYQFTYAVDPATGLDERTDANKFIRMPGANTLPGYLKIDAGFIKQGIDPNAYKVFLGKQLSGAVASRVNTTTVSAQLPPGYYAKRQGGEIVISGKPGAGTTQSLAWDHGLLAIGNKTRTPREVNKNRLDETADVTYETLTTVQIGEMVGNMFVKDTTGALKKPAQVDPAFKVQGRDTPKAWQDHIVKKPDLGKRPKTIDTTLGYTVNANRKSLSSFNLPELKTSDDKGHLVAARFNGPDSLNNLVPMNSNLNQAGGKWFDMENTLAQAYIGRSAPTTGDPVTLRITLNYGNFVRRPDSLDASWSSSSGVVKTGSMSVNNS